MLGDLAKSSTHGAHVVAGDGKFVGDVVEVFAVAQRHGQEELVETRSPAPCETIAQIWMRCDLDGDTGHHEVLFDLLVVGPGVRDPPGVEGIGGDHVSSGFTVVFTITLQRSSRRP